MKHIPALNEMVVSASATIRKALEVIDKNSQGVCFVVEGDKLLGLLTDGDIRGYCFVL